MSKFPGKVTGIVLIECELKIVNNKILISIIRLLEIYQYVEQNILAEVFF